MHKDISSESLHAKETILYRNNCFAEGRVTNCDMAHYCTANLKHVCRDPLWNKCIIVTPNSINTIRNSVATNCFNPPGAKITLDDSFYKRSEGDGSVDVCVHLKTEIKRDIDFELDANGLTAQGKIQTEAACEL